MTTTIPTVDGTNGKSNGAAAKATTASAAKRITVDRDGHVLLIGVNRPEKRNAFDYEMLTELACAYQVLGEDRELRAGVLYAHGDHFSAGLDLANVAPVVAEKGPRALGGDCKYDPFGVWAEPVPKPMVMAIQGIAYTLSIELALASDIVIVAEDVRFRQLEIGRGIIPFGGATFRAPRELGWGNAMRFLLTAEEFGAQDALRIGLAQEVTPKGKQVEAATRIAQLIAKQAPLAVQATLANARLHRAASPSKAPEHIKAQLPILMASADAKEGLQSFLERREAVFTGK